ncbi:MAG: hypothetical protein CL897_00610 [Dehalococcoidia bacterium]|nr:hypothetical protein [Dehalococcoidia bacterium]
MQQEQSTSRVTVLALDRWGSILVSKEGPPWTWLQRDESPDTGALRIFEEATGTLLEELHLFHHGEPSHHVYYCDPDLEVADLSPPPGMSLHYISPVEIDVATFPNEARSLLTKFVISTAYRAMFH